MDRRQTPVPECVEQNFDLWQRSLVELKRSAEPSVELIARQQRFVGAATTSEGLVNYLVQKLGIEQEQLDAAPRLEGVTEKEMLNTPFEWERHIGNQLSHITPQQARSSAWWYVCHVAWLQAGVFPNPPASTFKARVNKSILNSDPTELSAGRVKELDKATRNLLRWLGGLPHIRRPNRVAEDPPIARAWWRYQIAATAAESVAEDSLYSAARIHLVLHSAAGNWGRFIETSQRRYSSLLAPRALAAVCVVGESSKKPLNKSHLQIIARRCLQSHPDVMDWDTLALSINSRSRRVAKKKQKNP